MEYAVWIIIVVGMLILEASTTNLISIWFAAGALGAIVAKMCGGGAIWQFGVFAVVSALSLAIAWPFIKKHRNRPKTRTNADMIIGERGIVTDEITSDKFAGKVNVGGKEWSAVTEDRTPVAAGTAVKVKSISGVKLVVEKEHSEVI